MAIPFVPGPAPIWVASQTRGNQKPRPEFLGFSERGVNLALTPSYSPYHVDVAGGTALDYSYQGQSASISVDLTRWRPSTLAKIEDYVGKSLGRAGFDFGGEIGALMVHEGLALTMWVLFPYAAKAAYAGNPGGYRFFNVVLESESLPERGARPARVHLNFRALRGLVINQQYKYGLLGLYDYDMSAVANLVPD